MKKTKNTQEREFVSWLEAPDEFRGVTEVERKAGECGISFDRALELYRDHAQTSSVKDFRNRFGQEVVVGIPRGYISSMNNNRDMSHDLLYWRDIDFMGFLKRIVELKPMLSASSIPINARPHKFYHPIGVIFGDGEIYDASWNDLASCSRNGVRLRNCNYDVSGNLNARLAHVARVADMDDRDYNELIVGRYTLRGLFVNRDAVGVAPVDKKRHLLTVAETMDSIEELKSASESFNLPVFGFRRGFGFSKINPENI